MDTTRNRAIFTPGVRVTIHGASDALWGRTGTVLRRENTDRMPVFVIELDPTTDHIPGDYYANGGMVTVHGESLVVTQDHRSS